MTKPHTDQHKKGFAKDGTPIGTPPPHSHFYLNCVCREIVTNNPLIEDETSSSINSLFLTFHIHTHSLSLTLPSSLSRSLYLAHSISLSHFLSLSRSPTCRNTYQYLLAISYSYPSLSLSLSLSHSHTQKKFSFNNFLFLAQCPSLSPYLLNARLVCLSLSVFLGLSLSIRLNDNFFPIGSTNKIFYLFLSYGG